MKKTIVLLFVLLAGTFGYFAYTGIFSKSIRSLSSNEYFYVKSGTGLQQLLNQLAPFQNELTQKALPFVAQLMQIGDKNVKAGRYQWSNTFSNLDFLRLIRSGNQKPIKLVIFNGNTLQDAAGIAGKYLEKDSIDFLAYFEKSLREDQSIYTRNNLLSLFIPNTYEFFWNCSPQCFMDRMKKEHAKFWTNEKVNQLSKNGLNTTEAYVLASIVEKESQTKEERPTIAGVYLNRLKIGMLLQADPTVVFATGEKSLRRVLLKHLKIDSPYNTYLYRGLPPGPITMPSISSLDAVVNPDQHQYIYFCALPNYSGKHAFSKTLKEHNNKANVYRRWLSKNGIY